MDFPGFSVCLGLVNGKLSCTFKVQHTPDCNVECILRRSDHIFVAFPLFQMQTETNGNNIDQGEGVGREENRRDCFCILYRYIEICIWVLLRRYSAVTNKVKLGLVTSGRYQGLSQSKLCCIIIVKYMEMKSKMCWPHKWLFTWVFVYKGRQTFQPAALSVPLIPDYNLLVSKLMCCCFTNFVNKGIYHWKTRQYIAC